MEEEMEKQVSQNSSNEDEYLHLNDASVLHPTDQSKLSLCKLWQFCLLTLYGGSKHHSRWCKETYKAVAQTLLPEKEGASQAVFDAEIQEYISDEDFHEIVKQIVTTLNEDEAVKDRHHVFAKDLIRLAVSHGVYDARYRVTVKKLSTSLEVEWDIMDKFEQSLVEELVKIRSEEEERDKERQNEQNKRNLKRAFVIGLTAVGGGAILALSAGLAAPLIGAGAVAVLGSGSAAIFTGASGLAVITSIFGAAGAGLAGYKMTKRIGKIEQFEFGSLNNGKHLHVTLAVSGFCGDEDDGAGFSTPWEALDNSAEQYFLKWEGKYLRKLGSSIIDFVKREAMQAAVKGILKYTALRAVLKSIAWPLTLISAANLIDNPWNVCTQRSKETGIQLAHILLSRHQGYRPVTLIGFSLGARVIFYCLQTMLNEKDYQGIIEDVILIGAPVGVTSDEWEALESVISGTLYNCYSRSDWLLKFVYRAASVQVGDIAGLGPISVNWPRLKNIDLTEKINSHSEYAEPTVISDILQLIGYSTKPVTSNVQASAVKLPHEFVRDISRTPTKILPPNFTSASKDKLQQLELTAEEQETINRLTSCQNSNVIDSLKSKSTVWRGDEADENDSENDSPSKQSTWQKVMALTKRGSLPDKRMLLAPNEAPVEWELGAEEGETGVNEIESDVNYSGAEDDNPKRGFGEFQVKVQSEEEMNSASQSLESNCKGPINEVTEIASARYSVHKESEDDKHDGISSSERFEIADSSKGQGSVVESSKDEETTSDPLRHENKSDACLVFINDVQHDVDTEISDICDKNDSTTEDKIILSRIAEQNDARNSPIKIPGKALLEKVRRNVKFALPSPTLGRRFKEETGKSDAETTQPDCETSAGSFPKKAFRKMSFPGSL